MFSNKIDSLPSCRSYQGALHVWERANSKARSKTKWPDGTRPLSTTRDTQYAVIKDGAKIVFRLHATNCVEWHGPTSVTVDSSYDSVMTREFIRRFAFPQFQMVRMDGEGYVISLQERRFCRGIHTFNYECGLWHTDSPTRKPRKTVLHPGREKEVRDAMRPFTDWVKHIWAISGGEDSHPWMGKQVVGAVRPSLYMLIENTDNWGEYVQAFLPSYRHWPNTYHLMYAQISAELLTRKIREHYYNEEDCYIKIDYDKTKGDYRVNTES